VHGAAAHIHPVKSLNSHLDAPEPVSAPQRVTPYWMPQWNLTDHRI
jgi:hypothetical protein